MRKGITRRDFLNGLLLGTGALLLDLPSPIRLMAQQAGEWEGYGGVGDYALSHGNTEEVIRLYEQLQRGRYDASPGDAVRTGESYDLVVVGGGISGLSAAWHFRKAMGKGRRCLVLENHPVPGGQAKRNEFAVNGQRLIAPQASNSFVVVDRPGVPGYEMFSELGVPREFSYQAMSPGLKPLQFDRTNYGFTLWHDLSPSIGWFFDTPSGGKWVADLWGRGLEGSPYPERVRRDLLAWRTSRKIFYDGDGFRQWLDSMTYREYLEGVMGLSPEVTSFANPILASGLGLGCDAISAYAAFLIAMPGFQGFSGRGRDRRLEESDWHSFPGGNDGFSRHLLKALIPGAIRGGGSFAEILNGGLDLGALDSPGSETRIRRGSTAVRVEHDAPPGKAGSVSVTYARAGGLYQVKARAVVMASGGWMNKLAVRDLPREYRETLDGFSYSPVLVVNVALTNWRFLYDLGMTGCRWFSGFGFSCNIRQPMIVGDYRPPLDPGRPVVLTFYVPLHYPGLPPREQGEKGRAEILSTPYAVYEQRVRDQMVRLFGGAGFDPERDIAGIILNRWVYAYINPQPGFFFGRGGAPAPRGLLMERFGRISFGHAELEGHQNWSGAFTEGKRAAEQLIDIL